MYPFYVIGIGMGELTCRAKKILEQADVIITPVSQKNTGSRAFDMIQADISHAEILELLFPMKADLHETEYLFSGVLTPVIERLHQGKIVAMITIGDVSVYSTAAYVRRAVAEMGYQTEVIPGIPSFIDGAAKAQISLCEKQESLLMIPAVTSPDIIINALNVADNIMIMKAGKALHWLIPMLKEQHLTEKTIMFYNLGMTDEYIGSPVEKQSYFITLLIRKRGLL